MEKIVAYLDILGFGYYAKTDIRAAISLLAEYQSSVNQMIVDEQINNQSEQPIDKTYIDSFEFFLPFSDSIFIVSDDADKFIKQISDFLVRCFKIKSHVYINPINENDPTEVNEKIINRYGVTSQKANWYPLIFRGGVSYGEVEPLELNSIINSQIGTIPNLAGKALVEAVGMEEEVGKGPRLFCSSFFVDKLDSNSKKFIKEIPDSEYYEILWPAFYIIESENCLLRDLLIPIINLWKWKNHSKEGVHYFQMLQLFIKSFLAVKGDYKEPIKEILRDNSLGGKIKILMPDI